MVIINVSRLPVPSPQVFEAAEPLPKPGVGGSVVVAEGLGRHFGATLAVEDVSLTVGTGEILALLGPNGAGKTTTLQMLAGLLPPTAGRASVAGYDVATAAHEVRARVGLMVDEPGFYPEMGVAEYLLFMARLYGVDVGTARLRIDDLLERFDLAGKRKARLSTLSKGMRQKVALSRILLHRPLALFLDEPTSALDPLSARAVHRYIAERREEGVAIILCTHQLEEAEALADRVAIIAAGRLWRQGTVPALRRRPDGWERFVLSLGGPARAENMALLGRIPALRELLVLEDGPERHTIGYATGTADRTNAAIVVALVAQGCAVLALSPRYRSLGDVYLETIEEVGDGVGRDHPGA